MVFLICCIIFTACSTAQKSDSDNSESVQSALTSEASAASGEELTVPDVEAGIDNINKYGNITLTIGPDSMKKLGYEPADIITVKIGD